MSWAQRFVVLATVLTASGGGAADAAVKIDADFSFLGEVITPNNADISKAASIGFGAIKVDGVEFSNTGLVSGAFLTVTNPIPVGVGDMIVLSWTTPKGTFSASLIEKELSPIPDASQAIITTGMVDGPAGFSSSAVDADFVFNQDGSGYQLVGGVHAPTSDPAVPELSTWAMVTVGFAGLGVIVFRRSRNAKNSFC
jgi:hypothetical protein